MRIQGNKHRGHDSATGTNETIQQVLEDGHRLNIESTRTVCR